MNFNLNDNSMRPSSPDDEYSEPGASAPSKSFDANHAYKAQKQVPSQHDRNQMAGRTFNNTSYSGYTEDFNASKLAPEK